MTNTSSKNIDAEVAKRFLIASAEKDLVLINKCQVSLDNLITVGIIDNNKEHCDFQGLLRDCKQKLEEIVNNTFDPFNYDGNGLAPVVVNGKFCSTAFCFYSKIYDNCDFQFVPLWLKLIVNTKNCLESLGTKVYWATEGGSGDWTDCDIES